MKMFNTIRKKIWKFARRNHPEACVLTRQLICVRFVLYPIESLYWRLSDRIGYNPYNNIWTIHGEQYTSEFFDSLHVDGIYKLEISSGARVLTKIDDAGSII